VAADEDNGTRYLRNNGNGSGSSSNSNSSNNNDEKSDNDESIGASAIDACSKVTESMMNRESTANQHLKEAKKAYSDAMQSSMMEEEWSFGFSEEALGAYREGCYGYNEEHSGSRNVIWKDAADDSQESPMVFTCDFPTMKVTGKTVELYGIGDCLANTTECRAVTPTALAENLWRNVGLQCRAASDAAVSAAAAEGTNPPSDNGTSKYVEDGTDMDGSDIFADASGPETGNGGNNNDEEDFPANEETEGSKNYGKPHHNSTHQNTTYPGSSEENHNAKDEEEGDYGNENEDLFPGDDESEGSDGDRLPFVTDDDAVCMSDTSSFFFKNKGLVNAAETYNGAQIIKKEPNTEVIGYPPDAARTMKSACELKHGHWVFAKNQNFTCVVHSMEVMSVDVYNYGSCLAKTEECAAMNLTTILRIDLADMGLNCWEDEDDNGDGDGATPSPSKGESANTGSGNGGDGSEEKIEENYDESDSNKGFNSTEERNKSNESGDNGAGDVNDTEDEGGSYDNDETMSGLTDVDTKCMEDSGVLYESHPSLAEAIKQFGESMDNQMNDVTNMKMGFSDESVEMLRSACDNIGYFTVLERAEFVCNMMSVEVDLAVTNLANCAADTAECHKMDPLSLMEDVWDGMGIKCDLKTEGENKEPTPSTMNSTKSDDGNDKADHAQEDALVKNLGLTDSEVTCMRSSTSFVESSEVLSNATIAYEKSVEMTDPTKLGYSESAASELQEVCQEQGGIWSFIKSEDVTCTIKGRDRCIHVYNFGNCIASSDQCQSMDPIVLVRGFFMEVLNFKCHAKCEKHKDTTASPHKNNPSNGNSNNNSGGNNSGNNNLFSQQGFDSTSDDAAGFPWFMKAAVVLCVVAAVGLFGLYRFRASSGRERITRRTYEMTDMSDLRFETLT